jgi:outer membrane lipoprotein SlyB
MKSIVVVALAVSAGLSGCAVQQYRPVVDYGVSKGSYEADLADCQQLAEQRPAANNAAGGAAAGAILGALLGAAVGLRGNDIGRVAAWGAASGGVNGAAYGVAEQKAIVARCMAGRGYNVVSP